MDQSIAISVMKGCISGWGILNIPLNAGVRETKYAGYDFFIQATIFFSIYLWYIVRNSLLFFYSLLPVAFFVQRGTWFSLSFILLFCSGFLFIDCRAIMELIKTPIRKKPAS